MKLNEYLAKNAVKLMIKGSGEKNPTRQTNDLGMYDYVENLESVLGKMVWICDYRANADPTKKPIRNIKPTPVVVTDAKETSKAIYYSPVYFRPVNRGKISSTVIAPLDNTGYRCCSGTSVNIFYTKEECVKCYREQVRQANEIYEKEKARIIKEFDARMQSTAVRTLTSLNRNLPPMTQRIPMQSTVFWMSAASQKQDTKPAIAGKLGPKTVP